MTELPGVHPLPEETFCPSCGYDLHTLLSEHCPECGWKVDRESIQRESIPWIYRDEIGAIKAFFRTAWLASAKPKQLAGNASRPVNYHQAQKFRLVVVFLAALPLVMALLFVRYESGDVFAQLPLDNYAGATMVAVTSWQQFGICFLAGAFLWPVPAVGVSLLFLAMTGVGSYLFHPSWLAIVRQNRAVALSYYAGGSLAFMLVAYLPAAAAAVLIWKEPLYTHSNYQITVLMVILALFVGALLIVHWLYTSFRMLGIATNCTLTRQFILLAFQCAMLLLLGVATLGLFPAICGLIRILIRSI